MVKQIHIINYKGYLTQLYMTESAGYLMVRVYDENMDYEMELERLDLQEADELLGHQTETF